MKAPRFWFTAPDCPDWRARLFRPLSAIRARSAARALMNGPRWHASAKVISVCNAVSDTERLRETVSALVQRLDKIGWPAHVVMRMQRSFHDAPLRVSERQHNADTTGATPLLIAAFAPVWLAADWQSGIRAAEHAGAGVVVICDTLPTPSVATDLSLLVTDAATGFGNGMVRPSGPLLAPLKTLLDVTDAVLSIGPARAQRGFGITWGARIVGPHFTAELIPLETGMPWKGLRVLAFSGTIWPERFFSALAASGASVLREQSLPSGRSIPRAMLRRLETEARNLKAQLVTTEWDAVRLPQNERRRILTFPTRLELSDWTAFDSMLAKALPEV